MRKNLLIIGTGAYAAVAFEIATDMGCFEKIDFVDDFKKNAPNGAEVVGTTQDLGALAEEYSCATVAIGNPGVRLALLAKIKEETKCNLVSLVSPLAYVSPAAQIMNGCIIEPMAVIHSGCFIAEGCILSAGSVVNHTSTLGEGVHLDCNATVESYSHVPAQAKIPSGEVFRKDATQAKR